MLLLRMTLLSVLATPSLCAQIPLLRLTGTEENITYLKLVLPGDRVTPSKSLDTVTLPTATPPHLIAQCLQSADGKLSLQLLADFGNIDDTSFHPNWKLAGPGDVIPKLRQNLQLTMQFFGYTKWKPIKQEWQVLRIPANQLLYNAPGLHSANMEDLPFLLRTLLALPTVRINHGEDAAQFLTTPLLDALHNAPLCHASGL